MIKKIKSIPFEFVLELLLPAEPVVKPMFGCHAIYVQNKIVLILRKKEKLDSDTGVWLATTKEYHESLKKDFPSMRSITILGGKESAWQILPEESDSFEEDVAKACSLILKGDVRIGKIPKPKKKPAKKEKKNKMGKG
jgi:hypothetical protein